MDTGILDATTQHLSFRLGEELFAMEIGKVREVIEFVPVTKVPHTPDFMRGVINLRGGAVPVVDMKKMFGMGETERSINTCVIITEISMGGKDVLLGAMADAVDEVFDLLPEDIQPTPKMGTGLKADILRGMGRKGEKFVLILDSDRAFSVQAMEGIKSAGREIESTVIDLG
jgi:purine-binding chemotaxis protein CheW